MFGFEFLFGWALLALPLAGAPILLHLLFRRKSPVVPFSTLRFIRASVQQTAARKKIQQWLLLACRVLLLALLIWAVAQPARALASRWMHKGGSAIAAIVIDNSYSMLLQQDHVTRLDQENDAVQDLLRNELREARVALFTSNPPPADHPETLQSTESLLSQWSPLKPEPSPKPLADRVAAAAELLSHQDASDKWLIVLTDLQSKEFPHPLPAFDGGRFVLIDMHTDDPRSVGITKVTLDPPQPLPGVTSEAVVEITGRAGDARAVSVSLNGLDGGERFKSAPVMANLGAEGNGGGRVQLRFPVKLPNERFVVIKASLSGEDDLPWDDSRSLLVEIPPQQTVRVVGDTSQATRAIQLALDPNEGRLDSWPLSVKRGTLASDDHAAVIVANRWPSEADAKRLASLARQGGSVLLCTQPGLEQTWASLNDANRAALLDLLPSTPTPVTGGGNIVALAGDDALLHGLTDDKGAFPPGHVRHMVGFTSDQTSTALIGAVADVAGSKPQGILFRKPVGAGIVYTLGTLPDSMDSNLATSPAFLPLMVRMCLPSPGESVASNVELGQPLSINARTGGPTSLTLDTPGGGSYVVDAVKGKFTFDRAVDPGQYIWREAKKSTPIAVTEVQLPASESELIPRSADSVVPKTNNVVVARSLSELRGKMSQLTEPEPRWSGAVAMVLLLLCAEAMMASTTGMWKPILPALLRTAPAKL